MDSPLARVILALLGGYIIILILLTAYDWISEEYPRRPAAPQPAERIQHPFYHEEAVNALKRFSGLPATEKAAILENLASSLMPMEKWLTHIGRSRYQVICMGELHEESTRHFLAEEFFATTGTDVLFLEATPETMKGLIGRMEAGRDYFPLLGADILEIIRAARGRNPAVDIRGIEETDEQQNGPDDRTNSRDQSIASNFWNEFQPGKRHIILFGAFHCTNQPNWLYHNLCRQVSPPLRDRMLNVRVLGEHQNGPLEAFVYFLDEIGIEKKRFAVADTSSLHPWICDAFPSLTRQTLETYRSLVVFR